MAEIAYTEEFNPIPKNFEQTRLEYEGIEGYQVHANATINPIAAIGQTLYTVPKNKTLFVTSAEVSGFDFNYIYFGNQESIGGAVYTQFIYLLGAGPGTNCCVANSISFPMPIKCREGTIIRMHPNGAGGSAHASFTGFLIDKVI